MVVAGIGALVRGRSRTAGSGRRSPPAGDRSRPRRPVVVPHFAPGGGSPFAGRYEAVGGSPGGTHGPSPTPGRSSERRPTARRPVPARAAAAARRPAAPRASRSTGRGARTGGQPVSGTTTQTSLHFHYTAATIPALLGCDGVRRRHASDIVDAVGRSRASWSSWACSAGSSTARTRSGRACRSARTLAARDHVVTAHDRRGARAAVRSRLRPLSRRRTRSGRTCRSAGGCSAFPVLREARWLVAGHHAAQLPRPSRGRRTGRASPGPLARARTTGRSSSPKTGSWSFGDERHAP